MRQFLKDLNIVGCVGVWQEGDLIRPCLENLLSFCDYVVVMMDYPDKKTEDVIMEYKKIYPLTLRFAYTNGRVPALIHPGNEKRRAKVYGAEIVEEKLRLVKRIHDHEQPIDILVSPDSDEVFTDYFPSLLEKFWASDKTSICIKSIDIYDQPNIIHNKGMASHWRVYKYVPEVSFTPRRYRDFYYPYRYSESLLAQIGYFVHLSQIRDAWGLRDRLHDKRMIETAPNAKLWQIRVPAWTLSPEQYKEIINGPHTYILNDYEREFVDKT